MWQLNNTTPFTAGSSWVRDTDGAEIWIVVVKASFIINPKNGLLTIEENQPSVHPMAVHRGEAGKSSLLEDDHFVRMKKSTDIILNGHAYAPLAKPVKTVAVEMRVGKIKKRLRVSGDRLWKNAYGSVGIGETKPFTRMPIVYERAYGGVDLSRTRSGQTIKQNRRNMVGVGYAEKREALIGSLVPNIEYPGDLIVNWFDKPRPAGFSAIPCDWEPRVKYAGTYDKKWIRERQPLLPLDTDPRWYQQAPTDQQCDRFLSGGETVSLYNLTSPEKTPGAELHFKLPKMRLGFRTKFTDSKENHNAQLHTVLLEPDHLRVSLIWHSSLRCHNRDHLLQSTAIFSKEIVNA